ncbi:MAG: hypothetical protein ACFFD1_09895 [Candidatus Thorarchaeota archaeon]
MTIKRLRQIGQRIFLGSILLIFLSMFLESKFLGALGLLGMVITGYIFLGTHGLND